MPTHTYMSPEPRTRGVFTPRPGARSARLEVNPALSPATPRFVLRMAEIGLIAFTSGAGMWCLYEAFRLVSS